MQLLNGCGCLLKPPFMNNEGVAVDDNSQLNVLREALVNMLMHTDHLVQFILASVYSQTGLNL